MILNVWMLISLLFANLKLIIISLLELKFVISSFDFLKHLILIIFFIVFNIILDLFARKKYHGVSSDTK